MNSTRVFVSMAFAVGAPSVAGAATYLFNTDPFDGTTALTTPGRQIVGGEQFNSFDPAADVFQFDPAFFDVSAPVSFFGGLTASLPGSGLNVIVVEDTPGTLAAGSAADLIAAQITAPGAGFFIYHNTGLGVNRLVYSTDLDDPASDLKILARMTDASAQAAIDRLGEFGGGNFQIIPAPSTLAVLAIGIGGVRRRR